MEVSVSKTSIVIDLNPFLSIHNKRRVPKLFLYIGWHSVHISAPGFPLIFQLVWHNNAQSTLSRPNRGEQSDSRSISQSNRCFYGFMNLWLIIRLQHDFIVVADEEGALISFIEQTSMNCTVLTSYWRFPNTDRVALSADFAGAIPRKGVNSRQLADYCLVTSQQTEHLRSDASQP